MNLESSYRVEILNTCKEEEVHEDSIILWNKFPCLFVNPPIICYPADYNKNLCFYKSLILFHLTISFDIMCPAESELSLA